eukprot:gene18647-9855_t
MPPFCRGLPRVAAAGAPPAAARAAVVGGYSGRGQWRGAGHAQCCSTPDAVEGLLCQHIDDGRGRGGEPSPHWSCCGVTDAKAPCGLAGFFEAAGRGWAPADPRSLDRLNL